MKLIISLVVVVLFSLNVFSQTEEEKAVYLSAKKMRKRIVKMEFPNVPQEVRLCHAKGILHVLVTVDQEGVVKNVKHISGINHSICRRLREYVEQTVANWKFRPLKIKKEKVSFKGVISIPFCYGAFGGCY